MQELVVIATSMQPYTRMNRSATLWGTDFGRYLFAKIGPHWGTDFGIGGPVFAAKIGLARPILAAKMV